jgi:hypothetical protein
MKLAHLQQQIADLQNTIDLEWNSGSFSKRIVLMHSSISGAAQACKNDQTTRCACELAELVIQIVAFPSFFPSWGDIWGVQSLNDFSTEGLAGDLWDHLYKLHQLASSLVGGRSDIILLFKLLQVARAATQLQNIELAGAIQEQLESHWQTA